MNAYKDAFVMNMSVKVVCESKMALSRRVH